MIFLIELGARAGPELKYSQSKGLRKIYGFLHTLPRWKYSHFIAPNPSPFCKLGDRAGSEQLLEFHIQA